MSAYRLMAVLCLAVILPGCGNDGPERAAGPERARGLTTCLRDSGATLKEGPRFSHPDAPEQDYQVTLKSGSFAGVESFASPAEAERRLSTLQKGRATAGVRKGTTVVLYPGSSQGDATLLEKCLRASGDPSEPGRGELARQVSRNEARSKAGVARYRNRSYSTPAAITSELERLRSYPRYKLYFPGRRSGRLPLTGLASSLQPPAYQQSVRRLFRRPISPTFAFIYGSCEPPPGSDGGGCSTPLSVQNSEICAVNPNSFGLSPSALTQRIRGVPALRNEGPGKLRIFTGTTTISISAASRESAARAAANLRSLDGRTGPRSRLPPPVSGALEGRLRCKPAP